MTEGTIAVLLVAAELGVLAALALAVTAVVLLVRRHRERKAVDQLLATVAEQHRTRRPTLGGWLRRGCGYDEAAAERQADNLLAAEAGLYRQLAAALQERSPHAIAALPAAVDVLTGLYREAPPGADDEGQGDTPEDHDADLTKLAGDTAAEPPPPPPLEPPVKSNGETEAELVYTTGDEPDDVQAPEGQGPRPAADAGTAPSEKPAAGTKDQAPEGEAGDGDEAEERPARSPAEDAADDAARDKQQDDDRDPLEDLFDAPDEPDKEPPVGR